MYVRGYLQGSENGRVVTIGMQHQKEILSDGWKMSAIIKFSIKKIPGCMTYVVHPDLCYDQSAWNNTKSLTYFTSESVIAYIFSDS